MDYTQLMIIYKILVYEQKFILKYEGRGWRGSIAPRNFFGMLGGPAMQKAVENLGRMIDEEFDKLFK